MYCRCIQGVTCCLSNVYIVLLSYHSCFYWILTKLSEMVKRNIPIYFKPEKVHPGIRGSVVHFIIIYLQLIQVSDEFVYRMNLSVRRVYTRRLFI